jgi:SAM-dependent MidA family methyltransferase
MAKIIFREYSRKTLSAQPCFVWRKLKQWLTIKVMENEERHRAIVEVLRAEARQGLVPFVRCIELALYHAELGYYRANRERVGRTAGTDFTTAAALGNMFGELIASAAKTLVGSTHDYVLVEMGAEPGQKHFDTVRDRFSEIKTFRLGEKIILPAKCILVANELLDAQPFNRFIFTNGNWRELGVRVDGVELTVEPLAEFSSAQASEFASTLPLATEGWIIDASLAAETLCREILKHKWEGAVIFLDYGKTVAQCLESSPAGTARSYYRHQMSGDILTQLGSQDLTCHVLWDRITSVFNELGLKNVQLDRQEAFFVKYAGREMERIATSGSTDLTSRLRALTHPAHFGAKFQVLHGCR